jgi:hypothetical protein
MDDGAEPITDIAANNAVRRQAWRVQWSSVLAAAVLTALYLLVS